MGQPCHDSNQDLPAPHKAKSAHSIEFNILAEPSELELEEEHEKCLENPQNPWLGACATGLPGQISGKGYVGASLGLG